MEIEYFGEFSEEQKEEVQAHVESELGGSEFKAMTSNGRDEETQDYIYDSAWAFRASFIASHAKVTLSDRAVSALEKMQGELCEDANELVLSIVEDFDQFIEDAVSEDGHGHFLSPYDGNENEFRLSDGTDIYIYRQN